MNREKNQESLEFWRREMGLSQTELAQKVGVGQKTISRIEAGATPSTDAEKSLRRLGYKGPLGAPKEGGLLDSLAQIEEAAQQLAAKGFRPPNEQAAREMRKLIGQMLENSRGSHEPLAERVERVIRMARAIQK